MELCKVNGNLSLIMFDFGDKYFVMMSTSFSIFSITQLLFRFFAINFFLLLRLQKIFIFWFLSNFQIQSVPWDYSGGLQLKSMVFIFIHMNCVFDVVSWAFRLMNRQEKLVWKIILKFGDRFSVVFWTIK